MSATQPIQSRTSRFENMWLKLLIETHACTSRRKKEIRRKKKLLFLMSTLERNGRWFHRTIYYWHFSNSSIRSFVFLIIILPKTMEGVCVHGSLTALITQIQENKNELTFQNIWRKYFLFGGVIIITILITLLIITVIVYHDLN